MTKEQRLIIKNIIDNYRHDVWTKGFSLITFEMGSKETYERLLDNVENCNMSFKDKQLIMIIIEIFKKLKNF